MTSSILGVKSFVEYVLYSQPMIVRIATNTNAFIADIVTLLLGLPICYILDKHIRKILKEDNL